MRKAAEERWKRESEAEIRRVEQDMAEEERLAFFKDREERIAKLKEREEAIKAFEKRYGLQRKPQPVEVANPEKKKPMPTRLLPIQFLECEYRRERRIFAPPVNRLSRDAQHRSWDGYEWAIV
jgi:hypothetical protein